MTPFYLIRRLPNGNVDLHRSETGFPQAPVPPVFDAQFSAYVGMKTIAEYILADFFGEGNDSDLKAKVLAPLVGQRLGKLGSTRADLKSNGNFSWTVSESEIADFVADALVAGASAAGHRQYEQMQSTLVEFFDEGFHCMSTHLLRCVRG